MALERELRSLDIIDAKTPDQLEAVRRLCWGYRDFLHAFIPFDSTIVNSIYPTDKYDKIIADRRKTTPHPLMSFDRHRKSKPVGCGMYIAHFADIAEINYVYVTDTARGSGAAM